MQATPTSAGTLILKVNAGADLKDLAGNALVTTSAIPDDTTLTVTAGAIKPYKRSITQLMAITPAVGDIYSCTDCTLTYDLVVGTGSTAGGFRESGTNHGPQ